LYNSQLFIDDRGNLVGRHRKITPTLGERLVHAGGGGDGLAVHQTSAGRVSGLICGENSNPLAACVLAADGTQIHVASWPNHFAQGEHRPFDLVQMVSRGVAYSMGAFVLNACGTISPEIADELSLENPAAAAFLADRSKGGGSVIVAPDSTIVAGPMDGSDEGILSADIDLRQCVKAKHIHDYVGHYNRPDIFRLTVNRSTTNLVEGLSSATAANLAQRDAHAQVVDRPSSAADGDDS
jgi:aliphatic nitrilase